MPGKRDKAGNLTRASPGTHIVMDLQCNRAQRGRWRRQAATRRAALRPRRKHDASRPESDCWRSRCAINAPRPLSLAWPPMPGQIHRSGPHGQFGPRRQPNTPALGSRGRSLPKLRSHTSSCTDTPDLRPDTARTSAAAWQASRHAEPPALHRETGTQCSARQRTPGILRACLELASVSKRKGTAQTHDEKVRAPGGAQRAKIAFAIVEVAKRGI